MYLPTVVFIVWFTLMALPIDVDAADAPGAKQEQGEDREKPPTKSNAQSENPGAVIVQPGTTQPTEQYGYQIENYHYNPDEGWNWPNIVEAVSTLALVGFAAWQMGFIRITTTATRDAADAARNNAIAAERSALATEEISEKTEKNLQMVERAWLLVKLDAPIEIVDRLGTRIKYSIVNTGRTLARFKHSDAFITTSEGFPELPPLDIDRTRYNVTKCVIFPNTPIEQAGENRNIVLRPETIQRIATGSIKVIVRGFAVYDDILGSRHVTQFCQVWSPTWDRGNGGFVMPPETKPGYENDAD